MLSDSATACPHLPSAPPTKHSARENKTTMATRVDPEFSPAGALQFCSICGKPFDQGTSPHPRPWIPNPTRMTMQTHRAPGTRGIVNVRQPQKSRPGRKPVMLAGGGKRSATFSFPARAAQPSKHLAHTAKTACLPSHQTVGIRSHQSSTVPIGLMLRYQTSQTWFL